MVPEDTLCKAISRKSLILFISEIQKETNKSQARRDTEKRKSSEQRQTDRQTETFPSPSLCLAPSSTHLTLLCRLGRSRFRGAAPAQGPPSKCQLPACLTRSRGPFFSGSSHGGQGTLELGTQAGSGPRP